VQSSMITSTDRLGVLPCDEFEFWFVVVVVVIVVTLFQSGGVVRVSHFTQFVRSRVLNRVLTVTIFSERTIQPFLAAWSSG